MHVHKCRHCEDNYCCPNPRDTCFVREITCGDCYRAHEAKWIWLILALLIFSACAEVNRLCGSGKSCCSYFLRVCGGEPSHKSKDLPPAQFSPRVRR
jgi:hypothetical protein